MSTTDTPGDKPLEALRAGVQRARLGNALAGSGLVAMLGSLSLNYFAQINDSGLLYTLAGLAIVLAPVLLGVGWSLRNALPEGLASVQVEGDALVLHRNGTLVERIALSELEAGVVIPRRDLSRLELRRKNGTIIAVDVSPTEAPTLEAFLSRTGVGPEHRALRTRIGGWSSPAFRAVLIAIGLIFTVIPFLRAFAPHWGHGLGMFGERMLRTAILSGFGLVSWLLADFSLGPEVTVGTDGITLRRVGMQRFISHTDITEVKAQGGSASLTLKDGSVVSLGSTSDEAHATALVAHIRRAANATSSDANATARAALLDRGDRTFAAWRDALGRLLSASKDYRTASFDRGDLLAVVMDPEASVERRLGAALALVRKEDPEAAQKVRVAAEGCADEKVRVALEQIAAGTEAEAAIEEAIAARAQK